jgi:hypothetical protein
VRALTGPFAACALAGLVPFLVPRTVPAPDAFPGWPATFEGRPLVERPLGARDAAFARDFPGRVGRFDDGARQLVLRYVTRATRRLHPASDCFRGSGYAVRPLPLRRDARGRDWSCFAASRAGEDLRVCEGIEDGSGRSWSDPSSWYWSALGAEGPWWAVRVVEVAAP